MDEPISGPLAAARGVHLAACVLLLAVWIFEKWIIAGSDDPRISQSSRRIGRWLVALALPAALLSGFAWFYYVAGGMDPDEPMSRALLKIVWRETDFGHVWRIRTILWAAMAALYVVSFSPPARSLRCASRFVRTIGGVVATLLAAAFLASIAWAGHGATGPAPAWHRSADVVHLLVCAAWPGGLVPLALLLWRMAVVHHPIPIADAANIIRRFSATALASVLLLIGTGIINTWCLVGSFPGLWTTRYGQTLLLKLAVFLVIIALGAANVLAGKPRLRRLALGAPANGPALALPIIRRMASIVAIEAVLAFAIFAIVGVLGLLMPARM